MSSLTEIPQFDRVVELFRWLDARDLYPQLEWLVRTIERLMLPPERGPYSNSRIERCQWDFLQEYLRDHQRVEVTRFDRFQGSAVHELFEFDLKRGQTGYSDEVVARFLDQHTQYAQLQSILNERLRMFRLEFDHDPSQFVGSEEKIATTLGGTPVSYDDPRAWFRGIIDYLAVDGTGVATFTDFKNYPTIHSHADINSYHSDVGKQLMGYCKVAMDHYPSITKVRYQVYYARFGVIRGSSTKEPGKPRKDRFITRDEVDRWFETRQREMLAIERRDESDFHPQPSRKNCQYCDHVDACPYWEDRDLSKNIVLRDMEAAEEALNEYYTIKERETRLRDALSTFARVIGKVENESGGYIAYEEKERLYPRTGKLLEKAARKAGIDVTGDVAKLITAAEDAMLEFKKGSADRFLDDDDDQEEYYDRDVATERTFG